MDFAIRPSLTAVAALLALASCAPATPPYPELPRLTVATGFGVRNLCGLGVSPAIAVTNAPSGTVRYRVRMTNTSVLVQTPWQETIPATKDGIAEGAAASYPAPCMGTFQQYQYRFDVMALDANDRPLAYGQAATTAVALDRLVRQARRTPGAATPPSASNVPGAPPVIDREDERELMGTLPYRNYGPIVAPQPDPPSE
jgi:hypothetical protein